MNINDVIEALQKLTKTKITQIEIGRAINKTRSDISLKAKRGSDLKLSDIKKLEDYFDVDLINCRPRSQTIEMDGNIMRIKILKGQKLLIEYDE
jgi:IS30 family transposase